MSNEKETGAQGEIGTPSAEDRSGDSLRSSAYPIRALVKADGPQSYSPEMRSMIGGVFNFKPGPELGFYCEKGWAWKPESLEILPERAALPEAKPEGPDLGALVKELVTAIKKALDGVECRCYAAAINILRDALQKGPKEVTPPETKSVRAKVVSGETHSVLWLEWDSGASSNISVPNHVAEAVKTALSATDPLVKELVGVLQKVVKWNEDYPSSRIFSEGEIRKIAKEMDAINEDARAALQKAEARL